MNRDNMKLIKDYLDYSISYEKFFIFFCGMDESKIIEINPKYICAEDICKGKVLIISVPRRKPKIYLNMTYREEMCSGDIFPLFNDNDLIRLHVDLDKFNLFSLGHKFCSCNYTNNQVFSSVDDRALEYDKALKVELGMQKDRDRSKKLNRIKRKERVKYLKLKRRSEGNEKY